MELRRINPTDWKSYRDFRLTALQSEDALAFGGSYEKESLRTEDEWKNRLNDSNKRFFYGCFENNKLISAAGAYFDIDDKVFHDKWMIVGVYTNPEFRGKGLSTKNLEAVIGELKSKGVNEAILMVNTKQNTAIHLYEKLGFKVIDTIKDRVMGNGKVHDEFVMQLSF